MQLSEHQSARQDLAAALVDCATLPAAIAQVDEILYANRAFLRLFAPTVVGAGTVLSGIIIDDERDCLSAAFRRAEQSPARYVGLGKRGAHLFDVELVLEYKSTDERPTFVIFAFDLTHHRRAADRLASLAYRDSLTGLANRCLFTDRLYEAVRPPYRSGVRPSVLMADLDSFKAVNDTYGHAAGDAVLQQVARRFESCIRLGDTLARLGGDEFGVLLPDLADTSVAPIIAQRMIRSLEPPLDLGEQQATVGTSIGIAYWPGPQASVQAFLGAADAALYRAKLSGKNTFAFACDNCSTTLPMMQPGLWSSAHTIGISLVDEQHAQIATMLEGLLSAVMQVPRSDNVAGMLGELLRYTELHFATEERLMSQYKLADLDTHRQVHQRLLDDLRNSDLNVDGQGISATLRYLQDWLFDHIDGLDRRMGQALIAAGCDQLCRS